LQNGEGVVSFAALSTAGKTMPSDNPYQQQPSKAFWHSAITERSPLDISEMWDPKFDIKKRHKIATYGSCFAQHIGKNLERRGYTWLRAEPAVKGMSAENLSRFGYELFSSRTGNIYTTSQLLQWAEWALDPKRLPAEIWQEDGRFFDPFRPNLEPDGFGSEAELRRMQAQTCAAFKTSIKRADFMVFTLGLTERWQHKTGGYEYAMCPGTIAGSFDKTQHEFSNMSFQEVEESLQKALANIRILNPNIQIILTVSPVALAATASKNHVLVANIHSKSILRAVAGQMALAHDFIDYFPSYEIISNPIYRGTLHQPSLRGVNPFGVHTVMESFFQALQTKFGNQGKNTAQAPAGLEGVDPAILDDLVCEEELLSAFRDTP
jgi:hypothetical protein